VNRNWKCIEVIGFLKPADLGNPPIVSQHLMLTTEENQPKKSNSASVSGSGSGSDSEAKMKPNFSALLHGGLKMENMVGVVQLGASVDQFGLIYFIPDSKRSNLVLHVLESGPSPVLWLGDFRSLKMRPFEMDPKLSGFPINFKSKPTYGQLATIHACTENSGIQVDVQKIMRYARKLPDKESNFFLELNRVIDYALMIGCKELLELLSDILKKEADSSQSEAAIRQLKHVANMLRSSHLQYGQHFKPLS